MMELALLQEYVERIPFLEEEILSLKKENEQIRINSGLKEVFNVNDVCDYTGWEKIKCYQVLKEIGASKVGKTLFCERQRLIEYLLSNRKKTPAELEQMANNYIMLKKHKSKR